MRRLDLRFPDAVQDGRDLLGRDEAMERIRGTLRQRTRRIIVVLGGRRIGKTSVLNVVARWAQGRASFSVVRLAHARSRDEFAAEILHGICGQVGADCAAMEALFSVDGQFRLQVIGRFLRVVEGLAAQAPSSRFLICVDELDSLLEKCSDGNSRQQILDLILHLVEHTTLPIRFLFTLSQVPEMVRRSYGSPFLNQADIVELLPWSPSASRRFAQELAGGLVEFGDAAHQALFGAAGGHPYFTKAVLQVLLKAARANQGESPVSEREVTAAVEAAARAPEVAFALSNIVETHLSGPAVEVLDRAAMSARGIDRREIHELGATDEMAESLAAAGFLDGDGRQYRLRLGIWRVWRAARLERAEQRPALRLVRALRRLVATKGVRPAMVALLIVLLLSLPVATAFIVPSSTVQSEDCTTERWGLHAFISHSSYISNGDEHSLLVRVTNDERSSGPVAGSAIISFPQDAAGSVSVTGDNAIQFDRLVPGQQLTAVVPFVYRQPGRLLPDTTARIPVEFRISTDEAGCALKRWSMAVAPIPHLRTLRSTAYGLIVLIVIPLAIQMAPTAIGRLGRRPAP